MRWSRYSVVTIVYQAIITSRVFSMLRCPCSRSFEGCCSYRMPLLCITSVGSSSSANQSLHCDITITRHHYKTPPIALSPIRHTNRACLQLALRCSVDAISFSAHADFPQTSDFLDEVNPPHVVLVHGEAGEMMRLKRALEQRAKATDRIRNLYTPKVTQPVHIRHQPRHVAKVCPCC